MEGDTFRTYVLGLVFSLVLTLISYFCVVERLLGGWILEFTLGGLTLVQVIVQLVFFLHLGEASSSKPYWNRIIFFFMSLVVMILVFGSLWIMYNLDSRTMPSMG